MTAYTEAEYREKFLNPQVKVLRKVEILQSDGKTIWTGAGTEPRLIGGSVSVDYGRDERRTGDFELANFDNKLIHKPQGFWYDKILRAYRGIEFFDGVSTHQYLVPLGKFMIDRVSQPRFPNTVKITARDFTKKLMGSKFTETTGFVAGTNVMTIINALAANAGVFDRITPSSTEVLGSEVVFDFGTSRWEAIKQIAIAFNYEVFFDAAGFMVVRKFLDPTLSPVTHTFQIGPKVGNLVDWEKSTDDTMLFNKVAVRGTTDTDLPVYAQAVNSNPNSPTSTVNIGERVYPFESDIITTTAQAQTLADSLLAVNSLEAYSINLTSLVAPWLEAGEIARFIDPDAAPNDPDRFLLTSFSIPLDLSAMSATGRRLTIVGYNYGG